ncbi:uncharacterized protein [Antedon mediterranea]|uniref:uncharacterized protein n=1 Tax=Antedon mediterranea TaxID=105859 RepID=UPI003AF49C97
MDGYLYMLIIFLLVFKCSIYFCWYKARRERYAARQRTTLCTIQTAQPINVQNAQAPAAYRNQGMVVHPVTPQYQPPPPPYDKPPAYDDIVGNNTMNNQQVPTYCYSTGPTGQNPVPYPASGPTNPNPIPYPAVGPTSPNPIPYSASGPQGTNPVPYPNPTSPAYPYPNPVNIPYPYQTGATTNPAMTPYIFPPTSGASVASHVVPPTQNQASAPPSQM